MRATFFGFEAARKALIVSQTGLDVTMQNVSNINTQGYTRQRTDISSLSLGAGKDRYAKAVGDTVGQGAEVTGITQIRDQFLDARFRRDNAEYNYWNTKVNILSDVEDVIDEISTDALDARLKDFYNQLQSFAGNAETVEFASIFRSSAQKVVDMFRQYTFKLSEIKDEQVFNCETEISDVNKIVVKLAEYNKQIKGEYIQGATPNELLDDRNLLLDKLSGMIGTNFDFYPDGQVSVSIGGRNILDSQKGNFIRPLSVDASGYPVTVAFDDGKPISVNSGSVAAYLDVLNGKGVSADPGENESKGILYFQQSIDELAKAFADNFNTINDTLNDGRKLFTSGAAGGAITAGNIAISEEWQKDAMFITRSALTPTGGTPADGRPDNLLKMLESMNEKKQINPYFKGTFEEYAGSIMGDIGVEGNFAKDMAKTTGYVLSTIEDQRESVSGVLLDEEVVNMVKFQKAYNAAARLMTAMDEMLDVLINRLGIVGR